jgi:hypothetical protein
VATVGLVVVPSSLCTLCSLKKLPVRFEPVFANLWSEVFWNNTELDPSPWSGLLDLFAKFIDDLYESKLLPIVLRFLI